MSAIEKLAKGLAFFSALAVAGLIINDDLTIGTALFALLFMVPYAYVSVGGD